MNTENRNYTVNTVDGFNPYDFLVKTACGKAEETVLAADGEEKNCLTVDAQLVWFRKKYPEGAVVTECVKRDDGLFEFHAKVFRDAAEKDAYPLGCGSSLRVPSQGNVFSPFETSETMAIGRALRMAGFGAEVNLSMRLCEKEEEEAKAPEEKTEKEVDFEIKTVEEKKGEDVFAKYGVKPYEKTEEPEKEQKKEAEKEREKPQEKPCEDAGEYVIKPEDVQQAKSIRKFAGRTLSQIGKSDVKNILDFCGEIISEDLRSAAVKFAG